jgi:hypothetical protein
MDHLEYLIAERLLKVVVTPEIALWEVAPPSSINVCAIFAACLNFSDMGSG